MSTSRNPADRIAEVGRDRGIPLDDVAESIHAGVESLSDRLRALGRELTPDDAPLPDRREPARPR